MSTGVMWQQSPEARPRAQLTANEEVCCDYCSKGTRPGSGRGGGSERALGTLQGSSRCSSPGGAAGSSTKSWSWSGPRYAVEHLRSLEGQVRCTPGHRHARLALPQPLEAQAGELEVTSLWGQWTKQHQRAGGEEKPPPWFDRVLEGESQEGMGAQPFHPLSLGVQAACSAFWGEQA